MNEITQTVKKLLHTRNNFTQMNALKVPSLYIGFDELIKKSHY